MMQSAKNLAGGRWLMRQADGKEDAAELISCQHVEDKYGKHMSELMAQYSGVIFS
jgi:hypothetical protein